MVVDVRGRNLTITDPIHRHIERRLGEALDRFQPRIAAVHVRVEDVNGPRGGPDKRCRVDVALHKRGGIHVKETDRDLYAAVDRMAARVKRAVSRRCGQFKPRHRGERGLHRATP